MLELARNRFAHDYTLTPEQPDKNKERYRFGDGPDLVTRSVDNLIVISLPGIADTAEAALAAVRHGLDDGRIAARPDRGFDEVHQRFRMSFSLTD